MIIYLCITLYLVIAASLFKYISDKRAELEAEAMARNFAALKIRSYSKYDVSYLSHEKGIYLLGLFFECENANNYTLNLPMVSLFWLPFFLVMIPIAGIGLLVEKYSLYKKNKREVYFEQILLSKTTSSISLDKDRLNEQ